MKVNVLYLVDDPSGAEPVGRCLEQSGIPCEVVTVFGLDAYREALTERRPDLVLCNFDRSGTDHFQAFDKLQEYDPTVPFLVVADAQGRRHAVECLQQGMTDFIATDQFDRLPLAVVRALREATERRERLAAESALQVSRSESVDLSRRLQCAIRESHHRIKNNLQVLIALVDAMRMDDASISHPQALARLARHIRGLATLHDLLTHQTSTPGAPLNSVSARFALERLIPAMATVVTPRVVTLDADEVELSLKQISALSLLVNEVISNAIKHGTGAIQISLKKNESCLILDVCNDGAGFPAHFDPTSNASDARIGLSLIESIGTWDLAGILSYDNIPSGARVRLRFPVADLAASPLA